MATTAEITRTNGQRAPEAARPPSRVSVRRHRQLPLVVIGVLLVLGCALAFADASLHMGTKEQVLVLAHPVGVGQVLTAGDLQAVRVSASNGLAVLPVADEDSVLGRPAAVPLAAGALLTTAEVGSSSEVGSGFDVVAVGVKPGAYPPDLGPGDRVQVVPVVSSTGASPSVPASGSPIEATVLTVQAASADAGSPTVFSLQVAKSDADEVASLAAAGEASLVQVGS